MTEPANEQPKPRQTRLLSIKRHLRAAMEEMIEESKALAVEDEAAPEALALLRMCERIMAIDDDLENL